MTIHSIVPCNGCRLCCRGDAVRLLPGDDPSHYKTVRHDTIRGALMLDHKPNGDCIYLASAGCSIHETKPLMCKEMDCRIIAQTITRKQALSGRYGGRAFFDLWNHGKRIAYTLKKEAQP